MDIAHVAVWVARLNALGILISCAEYWAASSALRNGGLMSWTVARLRYRTTSTGMVARVLDWGFAYPNILFLLGFRAALAGFTLIGPASIATSPVLLLGQGVLAYFCILRCRYGHDGADQMAAIVFTSLGIAFAAGTSLALTVCIWFLTLQLCLSYCVAGIAKATAKGWRDGSYLTGIYALQIYGNRTVGKYLAGHRPVARALSIGIVGWEIVFPTFVLLPTALVACLFAVGFVFHLLNAGLMGLNSFVWSFVCLYPAGLYFAAHRPF